MRDNDGFNWPEVSPDETGGMSLEDFMEPEDEYAQVDDEKTSTHGTSPRPSAPRSGAGRPVYRYGHRAEKQFAHRGHAGKGRFPVWFFVMLGVLAVAYVAIGIAINTPGGSGTDTTTTDGAETGTTTATTTDNSALQQKAADTLAGMTTEQKVAQLFFVTPYQLDGVDNQLVAGDEAASALASYPVGGILIESYNISDADQVATLITDLQASSSIKLFAGIEEEGGANSPIAAAGVGNSSTTDDAWTIGSGGDTAAAYSAGHTIGGYLKALGFNVDFAPVANVLVEAESPLGSRTFSSDAAVASEMVSREVAGLEGQAVAAGIKYFPGAGSVLDDTTQTLSSSDRTVDDLASTEYVPFKSGIEAGAAFVMMDSVAYPQVTGDSTPATFSSDMVTDQLRNSLGYDGIIISCRLDEPAVKSAYSSGDAAVAAIVAGCDMVLAPPNLSEAYTAVLDAVNAGTISTEQLDASVTRILMAKYALS